MLKDATKLKAGVVQGDAGVEQVGTARPAPPPPEVAAKVGLPEDDRWVAPRRDKTGRGDARARLRRSVVSAGLTAAMNQALKAGGSEFSHSRQYAIGDEGRHIDWKATSRTDKLHSKVFTDDPEPAVMMIVSTKNWGKATIHERERRRHLEQVASLLGFSAEHHRTPFGVMVYGEETELFAVADGTPASTDSLLDRLAAVESPGVKDQREQRASLVPEELRALRGRPAVIFYCCDRPDDPIPPEVLALAGKNDLVRLTVTPDRISTAQPAMLRVMGSALGSGNADVAIRKKTSGIYDELIAQRLLDRQPAEVDATTTLTLSVAEPFDRQLVDFFRRPK